MIFQFQNPGSDLNTGCRMKSCFVSTSRLLLALRLTTLRRQTCAWQVGTAGRGYGEG